MNSCPAITFATLHVRRSAQAVSLAAGCLAAALPEEIRSGCRLLDFYPDQPVAAMADRILAERVDLLALPTYLWNCNILTVLCTEIRNRSPQTLIACGGPEATARAAAILKQKTCDLVISGEGEKHFSDLVLALAAGDDWRRLPGMTLMGPDGIVSNPDKTVSRLSVQTDSPWLCGLLQPTTEGGVLWETARGCTFGCDFCFDSGGHHQVRPLPEERLVAELELFQRRGVSQVWVLDSTFNFPPARGKQLLRLLAVHGRGIHFHLEAKADFLDRETVALLAAVDCSVQVGLQSAHAEILRRVHRPFDPEVFSRAINLLNAEGITFGLDLIYGLPGDNLAGFCRSLDFALQFAPNHLDIFPLAILPGTQLAARAATEGIQHQPEPPYEVLATPDLPRAELEQCRELAAAVDLFYNTGRAVGLLPTLLRSLQIEAVNFFTDFANWLQRDQGLYRDALLATETWSSAEVLAMQESFIQHLLLKRGHPELLPAALDLLRYHFHYAEAHLGDEVLPPSRPLQKERAWDTPWSLAPGVRLVPFHYEIVDLLDLEGADLTAIGELLRPVGSVALFVRRQNEVWCESLEEDFLKLLQNCDGRHSPAEIFAGSIAPREGMELVDFAVAEGLLEQIPPT
ncbi:B12-binding domain-containing radical SAM protein [Geothermobacter hydrogeniphilus]|uniref:Uncharacterized protein n=1 Tax=Geothermobacter hydrogeniphilus TaxID=1969733 RepID=A0A1X0XQ45_9BACT|nr:B12-binding domain-containing radical SAM protein [Geothermobacter hydrogeniphilus]ORJ54978.1 hypothetical protein B5V00_15460 [Geothermobacter hydrogeniphilus]